MLRGVSAAAVSSMIELIAMAVGLASAFIFVTHASRHVAHKTKRGTEAPRPMLAVLLLIGVSQFKQHRSETPLACSGRYRLVPVLVMPAAGLQLERVRNVLRGLTSIVVNQLLEHRQAPFQYERLTLITPGRY